MGNQGLSNPERFYPERWDDLAVSSDSTPEFLSLGSVASPSFRDLPFGSVSMLQCTWLLKFSLCFVLSGQESASHVAIRRGHASAQEDNSLQLRRLLY